MERPLIAGALARSRGVRASAAERLGITSLTRDDYGRFALLYGALIATGTLIEAEIVGRRDYDLVARPLADASVEVADVRSRERRRIVRHYWK